eukprot:1143499-Pelagomonas_calceolata.AAC.1
MAVQGASYIQLQVVKGQRRACFLQQTTGGKRTKQSVPPTTEGNRSESKCQAASLTAWSSGGTLAGGTLNPNP